MSAAMVDELRVRRQIRCAYSDAGHDFDEGDHGECRNCGLVVFDPDEQDPKS